MGSAALGREWDDDAVAAILTEARVPFRRPPDIAEAVGAVLAEDGVVAWFQGRSEFGPRALGNRSLLANPSRVGNIDRLNAIKGRESFRPVAPMVRGERAADIFEGPLPSPYMLFVHRVRPEWAPRIPAALHVDGTARVQTVDAHDSPLVARISRPSSGAPACRWSSTPVNTAVRPWTTTRATPGVLGSGRSCLAIGSFLIRRRSR